MDWQRTDVIDEPELRRFERLALPHLDAAYNLARWLTRNDDDAQDVVQDAMLRALRYFAGFRGEHARPWLLQIVRNSCMDWLRENHPGEIAMLDDLDDAERASIEPHAPAADEPDAVAARMDDRERLNDALAALPPHYREVVVLRELEDLSYRDIAAVTDVPVGTVMSRLARARGLLRQALAPEPRGALHAVPRVGKEKARP
jgi:RNA polymerase sigma-70 factor, ECF subfamily